MQTSDFPATPPWRDSAVPGAGEDAGQPLPAQGRGSDPHSGLDRFNTAAPSAAEAALLACCGSHRWAHRLAAHRPYPDLDALLAAADEASYDLTPTDAAEALAGESVPCAPPAAVSGGPAALTALRAAHAAYESRFGHVFVICLDGLRADERLDHVLAGIRHRLGHEPEEERVTTADELRRLARARLTRLVTHPAGSAKPLAGPVKPQTGSAKPQEHLEPERTLNSP
ncbi:2-oxo-4-hydroxy-4-carboxy-5-ureidoimidazoline decarboxylase [Streptomyces pathocidini]|uniref:2-oxo-4-hydroxy-4-carboxy-5-ureidoimidazoline decarboxylase n=1 Tax=Streptomyces pathocidini TaxID=1650571 RepID=A0ABW7UXK5_9ACTN|nr:2-oxo-4-hydroxy-4-carboxy-5-ureidoimidazoline decarboxylase [Streptomyces pathocidini]